MPIQELTAQKRDSAFRLYRRGLQTYDRIFPKWKAGLASHAEKEELEKVLAGIDRVCGGSSRVAEEIKPTKAAHSSEIEAQISAFRAFKGRGKPERIHSRKLDKVIVLACDEQQRAEMTRLGTVSETIYTCDEIIWLLKRDFGIEELTKIDMIMSLYDGQLVKPRPAPQIMF